MSTFKKQITLKILLFIIFSDILETITEFCFKKSALTVSEFQIARFYDIFTFLKGTAASPFLWLAILLVLLSFIVWSTLLSRIDLSVAIPIASFSYILVPLVSIVFLHENITPLRWLGIFFILLGVIFIGASSKETELS